MKKNHIINLGLKVTEKELNTALVISDIAIRTTTGKIAISVHKAMITKDGLLYGSAFQGNQNLAIEDIDIDGKEMKPLLDLIKKAVDKLEGTDSKKPDVISYTDLK